MIPIIPTACLLCCLALPAQDTASGFVFHDKNANGARDPGEPGVPEVLVSNGAWVEKTDAEGAYTLPVTDDTILFVVQPKGWQVPVNALNLPQFFYIHKPAGSPEGLEYPGVAPTGPLPESVDFPLLPSEVGETFSLFAFGDPQPYSEQDVDYFRRDIVEEAMKEMEPVAGVSLGDIVGDDLDLFDSINAVTVHMGRPWWHVYGNHDMNFDVEDPELADETFERVYGPATYAFQIGDVVFIAFDNVHYPNTYTDSFYTGGFTRTQLTFLANLLNHIPEDHLVVSMMHIPLYDEGRDSFIDEQREAFFQLFKNHKYTLSLSAHTHTQNQHEFDHTQHWPHIDAPHHHFNVGTTSGSWWRGPLDERGIPVTTMRDGTPNGYVILNFDGNQYSYDFRVAGASKDKVMNIYTPQAVPFNEGWSYAEVAINFFIGCDKTRVRYRVNDRDWRNARREILVDPQYAYNRYARDRDPNPPPQKSLPYPDNSTHLWTGRLPTDLDPGVHTVEVKVTDRFGRVFTDTATYRIVGGE